MSYDIYIGQRVVELITEDGESWEYDHVKEIESPDAPDFFNDSMSAFNNGRHPSYTGWSGFARSTGLYDFFFKKDTGLMREHPGTFDLLPEHFGFVVGKRYAYQRLNPLAIPTFDGVAENANLARLLWLEWWMAWALNNCTAPAIHNH